MALAALLEAARAASGAVPLARRSDWQRLLSGFAHDEAEERQRARVEGVARACALFQAAVCPEDPPTCLAGIGAKGATALAEEGVTCVADLLWTLPVAWDDLREPLDIGAAVARASAESEEGLGRRVCIRGLVKSASVIPMRGRRAVRVVLINPTDATQTLHAWWFFVAHGVLAVAKPGAACLVVGRIRVEAGKSSRIAHPHMVRDEPAVRVVVPRYPRVAIGQAALRRAIGDALERAVDIADPVPAAVVAREQMTDARALLCSMHAGAPQGEQIRAVFERLAWAEAFSHVRERLRVEAEGGAAIALPPRPDLAARLRVELGFSLTSDQNEAVRAVECDLAREMPMRRLLLGDVGTGKTAVALAAIAQAVGAGMQAAILAPTTVLAEQYMDAVAPLARATGAAIALVSAGAPAPARKRALAGIASGAIAVAIGTHALLSEEVRFARLALVVVDEQHRLGVAQRLALARKSGARPHLLTLSATPIPRTLALALRGDLATSELTERPRARPPVTTEMRPRRALADVLALVRQTCARGDRVFFVAPRIDIDAEDDLDPSAGAVARAEQLRSALAPDYEVTLVHGGMKPEAKRRAMRAFRTGAAQVLVGTTVIEVGVDVPEATLIVIDHAERFGLAQLHQMRGRVGRGPRPGRAVLLYDESPGAAAERRMRTLCEISSGAAIARADLEQRGAGDLSGTRQHGAENGELLFLDPAHPPGWLARLETDARAILEKDPELALPEHAGLALAVRHLRRVIAVREEAG